MSEFKLTEEIVEKLEKHSADIEKLKMVLVIANDMVWKGLMEADKEGENYKDRVLSLGAMTYTLVEIAIKREKEIDSLIYEIYNKKQEAIL